MVSSFFADHELEVQHLFLPDFPTHAYLVTASYHSEAYAVEVVKAGQKQIGLATLSDLMDTQSDAIVAINGGFFKEKGIPVHDVMINKHVVLAKTDVGPSLVIGDPVVAIEETGYTGFVEWQNEQVPIHGVNTTRNENELVVYNAFFRDSTGTNKYGVELGLRPVQENHLQGGMKAVVERKWMFRGNNPIPPGLMMLSAHGKPSERLRQVTWGDTITVHHQFSRGIRDAHSVLGGNVMLVKNGTIVPHGDQRHPRTVVGVNTRKNKVFFLIVDGRSKESIGLSLAELARLCHQLNMTDALNLDGGGSSTLWVNNKVMNKPASVTNERPISTAIMLKKR
ncbi:MAG: phosphodiester glycosidase family protein [Bacteroidota bacterium]